MKIIINGKTYNTETATEIAKWTNGRCQGDQKYTLETLYKTRRGVYFLYVEGGPLSIYGLEIEGIRGSGREIIEMQENEAVEWLRRSNRRIF